MVTNEGKFVCVGDFEQQGSSECFLLYRHALSCKKDHKLCVLLLCADSSKHAMKDGAAVLSLTPVWVSAGVLCH